MGTNRSEYVATTFCRDGYEPTREVPDVRSRDRADLQVADGMIFGDIGLLHEIDSNPNFRPA